MRDVITTNDVSASWTEAISSSRLVILRPKSYSGILSSNGSRSRHFGRILRRVELSLFLRTSTCQCS